MSLARRIGILAGGGSLPREVADSVAARGTPVHIVAIDSEADADFTPYPVTRVGWGEIGRMIRAFQDAAVTDLVIIGSVRRPDLGAVRPDLGFFRALATVGRLVLAGGDDRVLRGVIAFFEGKGLRVVGPARVAPELLIAAGTIGKRPLDDRQSADARLGFDLIGALGAFDIGQAVIVADGRIEAIEGAEGTDRLLRRVGEQRRASGIARGASRGVLVKRAKPAQDQRIDLPVIGPETITRAVEAGLDGIVVEAGHVLAARRCELQQRAETSGLAVAGLVPAPLSDGERQALADKRRSLRRGGWRWVDRIFGRRPDIGAELTVIGRHGIAAATIRDVRKANAVVAAMERFGGARVVASVRGHVLAVECGEGVVATVDRAAAHRQWGDRRIKRRAGAAVLAAGRDVTPDVVAAVASAGLAGIAVRLKRFTAGVASDAVAAADRAGLFVVGIADERDVANG